MTELQKEVKRWSTNDGTRKTVCLLRAEIREVKKFMSNEKAPTLFTEALQKFGRPAVAVGLACTLQSRKLRTDGYGNSWSNGILAALQFSIKDNVMYSWNDGLHPLRIMEYAGKFIQLND